MKKQYKSSRKYQCPYCDFRATRGDLVDHIERKHDELIPEKQTAAQVVYEVVNHKNYGTCMICKCDVHEWDEKLWRYKNLCNKQSCRDAVKRTAAANNIRVYGKPVLTDDPDMQEKMLAHRRISGEYRFQDGGKRTYTGQNEKKLLQFMDVVMNISSEDIQSPGPVLEYDYEGKKHFWITDVYYIPANLLIEVKDGGNNPNNRPMQSYRDKQIAKEEMITSLGKFNYLRLTNNQFEQLLLIMSEIKQDVMLADDQASIGKRYNINEEVGGIPPSYATSEYIVQYGVQPAFSANDAREIEGYALKPGENDDIVNVSNDMKLAINKTDMLESRMVSMWKYTGPDVYKKLKTINEAYKNNEEVGSNFIAEVFLGHKLMTHDDFMLDERFQLIDLEMHKAQERILEVSLEPSHSIDLNAPDSNSSKVGKHCFLGRDPEGYFVHTPQSYDFLQNYKSDHYASVEDIPQSVIDAIDNLWEDFCNRVDKGGVPNA